MSIKILCIIKNKELIYLLEDGFSLQIINGAVQLFFSSNIDNINLKNYDIILIDDYIQNMNNIKKHIIMISSKPVKNIDYILLPIDYKKLYEKIVNIHYSSNNFMEKDNFKYSSKNKNNENKYIPNGSDEIQETIITTIKNSEKNKLQKILEECHNNQKLNKTIMTQVKIIFEEIFQFLKESHLFSNKEDIINTTFIKKNHSFHINLEMEEEVNDKHLLVMLQDVTDMLSISKKDNKNLMKFVWNF
ncbi:hypothetical protein AB836_01990 [Rickettsiales bacterium (ex Bugula neritina AB1)]|nr:hypothetical protein AB836_01990 [Rickettsiales bacterium (ex Bugula neritina AB1)]